MARLRVIVLGLLMCMASADSDACIDTFSARTLSNLERMFSLKPAANQTAAEKCARLSQYLQPACYSRGDAHVSELLLRRLEIALPASKYPEARTILLQRAAPTNLTCLDAICMLTLLPDATVTEGGFERIDSKRPLQFPQDHGMHWNITADWYYMAANFRDSKGGKLSLLTSTVTHAVLPTGSPATSIVRRGLSLTRVADGKEQHWVMPDVASLASADTSCASWFQFGTSPFTAAAGRLPNLKVQGLIADSAAADPFPMRLSVGNVDVQVELTLRQLKPKLLQGPYGNGYVGVGALSGGNAWLYYSYPRLSVDGNITLSDGTHLELTGGLGWMDHQWGSIGALDNRWARMFSWLSHELLPASQTTSAGWNWYYLQMTDGTEFTGAAFNHASNQAAAHHTIMGAIVATNGTSKFYSGNLTVLSHFTSQATGTVYPSEVQIEIGGLDVIVKPIAKEQLVWPYDRGEIYEGGVDALSNDGTSHGVGFMECMSYTNRTTLVTEMLGMLGIPATNQAIQAFVYQ